MRRFLGTAVALIMALGAAACGTEDDSSESNASANDGTRGSADAFPVTIDSALGETTIAEVPERVVTVGWGSQDAALALDVVPVGMQDFSADCGCDDGILPWDREKLDELGAETPETIEATSDEIPYEQIASLEPDVILAVYSGVTEEQYERLSQIAPTVGYPDEPWITSWQDQVRIVAEALGKSDEAETLIQSTNEKIGAAAKEHPEFEGKTIAFGSGTEQSSFNFYYENDARVDLLTQLGFTASPDVSALGDGGSESSFAKKVSLELLPEVKTDVLVSWFLDDSIRESIEGSQIFEQLPYVKNDAYIPITDPPLVYATSAVNVLNLPWMLDEYLPLLSRAAKNVKD